MVHAKLQELETLSTFWGRTFVVYFSNILCKLCLCFIHFKLLGAMYTKFTRTSFTASRIYDWLSTVGDKELAQFWIQVTERDGGFPRGS